MERVSRVIAVVFVVVGGLVHLQLWRAGYRVIPRVGPAFLANVVVSGLLAAGVLLRDDVRVHLAGITFAVASLAALVMSRTVGLLGFTEKVWTTDAITATGAEVGAIVALATLAVMSTRPGPALLSP
jgi:hypothetical protein